MKLLPLAFLAALAAGQGIADAPKVLKATARHDGEFWTIDVTLTHPDTGWDHYARGWEVTDPEGNRLGYRELSHPHVGEQPFTRSIEDLSIPDGTSFVLIRPKCSLSGWAPEAFRVSLTP